MGFCFVQMFKRSALTIGGLVAFTMCIIACGAVCSAIHVESISDEFIDKKNELEIKICCLEKENEELREVVKNYQKQPKKRNIKKTEKKK